MMYFSGDLAPLGQQQLLDQKQQDDLRVALANIASQERQQAGHDRVGMDANSTSRYNTDSTGRTTRYNTDSQGATSRYGVDAARANSADTIQYNRWQALQNLAEADKTRQAQLGLINAKADADIKVAAAAAANSPFGNNTKAGQDYFDNLMQLDQANQNDQAITAQANATLPAMIEQAEPHLWTTQNTMRDALANPNPTSDQAVLRAAILNKALSMPGAVDPTSGVPRFTLSPTGTNFTPVIRNPPMMPRRTVQMTNTVAAPSPRLLQANALAAQIQAQNPTWSADQVKAATLSQLNQ